MPLHTLRGMFAAAVAAAHPAAVVPGHLPPPPRGRTVVVGAGKASAAMARAVEQEWPQQAPLSGLVVTRYGHGAACRRIQVQEAAHPLPDRTGTEAARRVLASVQGLSSDDLVLALFSGGGSALLNLPLPGVELQAMQDLTHALLRSGASIAEINTVRKHLSAVSGGRLGAACHPARMLTLLISDVPGDDPSLVASGPTAPDPTTAQEAWQVLSRYGLTPSPGIAAVLASPAAATPKPGDPRFAGHETHILATSDTALRAAADHARAHGMEPVLQGQVEGEARRAGAEAASLAAARAAGLGPQTNRAHCPQVLLSGGETTVTVRGEGRGGRNTEFLLALAVALQAHRSAQSRVWALAADTDGIDGDQECAGAVVTPQTLPRARRLGMDPATFLAHNDSGEFFARLGDLVVTGPTRTNVNDFRAILIA